MIRKEKYPLALADGNKKILDYVYLEVRGPETNRDGLSEEERGASNH
jgi:hypothetical protein